MKNIRENISLFVDRILNEKYMFPLHTESIKNQSYIFFQNLVWKFWKLLFCLLLLRFQIKTLN